MVPDGTIGMATRLDNNWFFSAGRVTVMTTVLGSGVSIDTICATGFVFGSSFGCEFPFEFPEGLADCVSSLTGTVSKKAFDLVLLLLNNSSNVYFTSSDVNILPL